MELYYPIILDGATGTQLQKAGFTGEQTAEEWVLEHPSAIEDIQGRYIAAGSNVVYASTFGANGPKLEEAGIFNQVESFNKRLVGISKKAADGRAFVAGDIAPTAKFLAPLGDLSFDEMVEIYTEQAQALEDAGVDLFVVETMMTVPDARAAVLAIRSVSEKPVFVTFTCNESGRTLTGSDVTAALEIMQGLGVSAFGLNCSSGPEDMLTQIRRLAEFAEVPLIAKPNAGLPVVEDGKTVYHYDPANFTAIIPEYAKAGVALFGACCGSDETHIAAIAEAVKASKDLIRLPDPLQPKHADKLIAATEKKLFLLPKDVQVSKELACDENLADTLEDVLADLEELEDAVLGIRISSDEELDYFSDNQYAITVPLCIMTDDPLLLEEALRLYQGRALYEGSVSEDVLKEMQEKYGVIW